MRFRITSETLTQGRITREVEAFNYADALLQVDEMVDILDGISKPSITFFTPWHSMPMEATFNELLTWEGYANYCENVHTFQFLFVNGVFYTGHTGSEVMHKCRQLSKLDPVTM